MSSAAKAKILVVDDEPVIRELLERVLLDEGYRVISAADGPEAVDKAASEKPDLILMDIQMPNMDGIAACRKIRESGQAPNTRIIMLTAYNTRDRLEESIRSGADDFLGKPIDAVELKVRVRSMLRVKDISEQVDRLLAYVQSMNPQRGDAQK
jgi:CheY-like chemotaxis protein